MKYLLFLLLPFAGFTQTMDSIQVSEAERIVDKYVGKVSEAFNSGVEQVTPMAKEGFEVVVRLKFFEGLVGFFLPLFLLVVFSVFSAKLLRSVDDWSDDSVAPYVGGSVISLIIAIISFMIFAFDAYTNFTKMMVPEWYAIKEILNLF